MTPPIHLQRYVDYATQQQLGKVPASTQGEDPDNEEENLPNAAAGNDTGGDTDTDTPPKPTYRWNTNFGIQNSFTKSTNTVKLEANGTLTGDLNGQTLTYTAERDDSQTIEDKTKLMHVHSTTDDAWSGGGSFELTTTVVADYDHQNLSNHSGIGTYSRIEFNIPINGTVTVRDQSDTVDTQNLTTTISPSGTSSQLGNGTKKIVSNSGKTVNGTGTSVSSITEVTPHDVGQYSITRWTDDSIDQGFAHVYDYQSESTLGINLNQYQLLTESFSLKCINISEQEIRHEVSNAITYGATYDADTGTLTRSGVSWEEIEQSGY